MPTLHQLSRALGADLELVGSISPGPQQLTGVHISELPDPRPYLNGGELLLTTGMNLTMHTARLRAYTTALVGHDVRGLALGLGPVHERVPPVLIRVCDEVGMPLYSIPAPTAFQYVARRYWELLATEGRADLDIALGAQRDLVRAASDRRPVDAVVRVLASAINGWAAHLAPDGRVVDVWPRGRRSQARQVGSEVRRLRAAGPHSSATFPLGEADVAVQPLSRHGRLLGFLATAAQRPIPQRQRQLIATATSLLSLAIELRHAEIVRRRAERESVATLVMTGRVAAARELASALSLAAPSATARVVVTGPLGREAADELVDECDRLQLPVLAQWRADHLRVLADPTVVRDLLDRADSPLAAPAAERRTIITSTVPLVAASGGSIVELVRNAEALLRSVDPGHIVDLDAGDDAREAGRRDWLVLRSLGRPELEEAVTAYLRHRGTWERAAGELGCHRNTLRHRIATVQSRTGIDLDDPTRAAALWLARAELTGPVTGTVADAAAPS